MKREEIISYVQAVIEKEAPANTSAYLFGSYANQTETSNSDLDLLIVCNDEHDNPRNIVNTLYKRLINYELDYDILGYTKNELLKKLTWNRFFKNIVQEGKLLYGPRLS